METAKKDLIKKLKKEAQKSFNKVLAATFDQNIRNARFLEIQNILAQKIKEVELM